MAKPAPQNPQLLAATVAALRATAEGRGASPFETTAVDRTRKAGIDPGIAAKIVRRFDGLNEGMRRSALGRFFDPPVNLERIPPPSTPTAARGGGVAGRVGSRISSLGVLDPVTSATYMITFRGLVCEAETSWDRFSNSDEVYAITLATHYDDDGQNFTRSEEHPIDKKVYEDVDAREERIGPVAAVWEGTHLPVSLTVVAFEHDEGDPNAYRAELAAIIGAAATVIGYFYGPGTLGKILIGALTPLIIDGVNWLFDTDDDQIDSPKIEVLDLSRFEELGRYEPLPYFYAVQTNLYGHFFSHHSGSGARYVFGFQVARDPAFKVEDRPIL